jgi:hypothetical protein
MSTGVPNTQTAESSSSSAPVVIARQPIVVRYVRPVFEIKHRSLNTKCEICQRDLFLRCSKCNSHTDDSRKVKCSTSVGTGCPLKIGVCNHSFHKHCIDKWLEDNEKCPIDMESWRECVVEKLKGR